MKRNGIPATLRMIIGLTLMILAVVVMITVPHPAITVQAYPSYRSRDALPQVFQNPQTWGVNGFGFTLTIGDNLQPVESTPLVQATVPPGISGE